MSDYRNYEAEDFLSDEFFIEWVLQPKPEHQQFWETWLAENPDRAEQVQRAASIIRSLHLIPNNRQLSDADITEMTARFLSDTEVKRSKVFILPVRWLAAAAVLVLALVSGLLFFKQQGKHPAGKPVLTASNLVKVFNNGDAPKVVQLSDGSIVVLKTRSEIAYPVKFSNTTREVSLKGEAFFEVRKNPAKAFLVHAGNMVTRVLGTSFTVSAYDSEKEFKVVVNTGKVQVYDRRKNADGTGDAAVVLTPNLQAVYQTASASFKKDIVKVPLILSPELAKKEFLFTNTPLPVIIAKLEHAYGVTIAYDKQKYADVTVTASLSRLPLDEKVRAICKAVDAVYEFKDGKISIK